MSSSPAQAAPSWRRWLVGSLGVGLIASAVDLIASLAAGYRFRTDQAWLLGSEVAAMGLLGTISGLALLSDRRGRWVVASSLPWIAAAVSVALMPRTPAVALLMLGGWLVAAAVADWRRLAEGWVLGLGACAALIGGGLSLRMPVPGFVSPPVADRAQGSGPDVVLIVLDTLRADHIEAWGYERATMPWLTKFAAGATLYENATSASSWTLPSHATLFTGLLPESHGADRTSGRGLREAAGADHRAMPLAQSAETLAERLSNAGYRTGAACGNVGYLNRMYGLDQGFDSYVDAEPYQDARPLGVWAGSWLWEGLRQRADANGVRYRMAPEVSGPGLRWWNSQPEGPRFLFLNFMEAHAPNYPGPAYRDDFPEAFSFSRRDWAGMEGGRRAMGPDDLAWVSDAYDAELRTLDAHLASLFVGLGDLDEALVIITADHGESFGEHDFMGHGRTIQQPEVHIPMIIKYPGQREGRRVATPVHLADVLPTVAEVVGLTVSEPIYGQPLVGEPELRGLRTSLTRPKFMFRRMPQRRDHRLTGWRKGKWKLEAWSSGESRLFDLEADPGEKVDLAEAEAERVREMRRELKQADAQMAPKLPGAGAPPTGDKALLKALGYVE
jgi:arylsulfatase A-like enzyme